MKSIFLIFPHQLFENIEPIQAGQPVYLIEEYLFFSQYKFHKQKLVLHRASMKYYEHYLGTQNVSVRYIEAISPLHDVRKLIAQLATDGIKEINYYEVCDNWLEKRITQTCTQFGIKTIVKPSPLFINTLAEIAEYFVGRSRYFQTDFYIQQRKKLNILLDQAKKPLGGKWSFDAENRLKYPKDKTPPQTIFPQPNTFYQAAVSYVQAHYADNYGSISNDFTYPSTHQASQAWLKAFLEQRFAEFGAYEDAIVAEANVLHHSLLTPMLNIGLLTPWQVIETTLDFADEQQISLNTLEGFIRQIIGWREFIRGVYVYEGVRERKTNFWQFTKKIPSAFYDATTGIEPIDATIRKVLATGYCHHIERLMLLGNFMLLNEFAPDAVYQWFMELFIDAYDWVMVPNVYGMSQFADGGLMATKPYISGSSYVLKMSNYPKGKWCEEWDALFWHFMNKQRGFFTGNPRLGMLIKTYDKMSAEKKQQIAQIASQALTK
ncbi:MAG: cryptochrome/photolyase family protein [Microscillaceae bacterium]|nr:cryptochrome/photolyase family protein [Microscillaceae bacterium]